MEKTPTTALKASFSLSSWERGEVGNMMFPLTKASSTIVTSDPVSQLPEPLQIQRFLGNYKSFGSHKHIQQLPTLCLGLVLPGLGSEVWER